MNAKHILATLLALACLFSLPGCGKKEESKDAPDVAETSSAQVQDACSGEFLYKKKNYTLPLPAQQFIDWNFIPVGEAAGELIDPGQSSRAVRFSPAGVENAPALYCSVYNAGSTSLPLAQCEITSFLLTNRLSGAKDFSLPGGISLGSTQTQIKTVFGVPGASMEALTSGQGQRYFYDLNKDGGNYGLHLIFSRKGTLSGFSVLGGKGNE